MHPLDILFLACLMLGGMYMAFTLLMGGLSHAAGTIGHHVGDVIHIPHHFGDAGAHAHGHADAGHAGHHHGHHGDAHHHGDPHGDHHASEDGGRNFQLMAYLNPSLLAGFFFGFGGLGVVAHLALKLSLAVSVGAAAAGGLTCWYAAYMFVTRVFGRTGGTSHNRREDLVGSRARVTAPIAGKQPGMIAFTIAGARQTVRAITAEEEAIPVGTDVRIRRIEENTVVVSRID